MKELGSYTQSQSGPWVVETGKANPWHCPGSRQDSSDQEICLDRQSRVDFHAGLMPQEQVFYCAGFLESSTILSTVVQQNDKEGCTGLGTG